MAKREKDRFLISILGEQTLDGETDKIEVLTAGNFMKKKDHFYIGYQEYDDENPPPAQNGRVKKNFSAPQKRCPGDNLPAFGKNPPRRTHARD